MSETSSTANGGAPERHRLDLGFRLKLSSIGRKPQPPKADHKHNEPAYLRMARAGKLVIQGVIAAGIVLILSAKAAYRVCDLLDVGSVFLPHLARTLRHMPTLTVVGRSLAYSAGAELAYMLLTPGPDEAIDPLIVGLAASVLVIISDENFDSADKVIVPISCLAIGFLLFLKRHFHDELNGRADKPLAKSSGDAR